MNAGTAFAQSHQLRPGIELSAEQMDTLDSDIAGHLSGGWEAFAKRVKIDLPGVKPDESKK